MSWFTIGWIGWGLYFAVLEGIALFNKGEGDTLSEHVWRWFDVDAHQWTAKRYLLVAFMLWLSGHFIFRIWATVKKRKAEIGRG
jgi:hypothetical protein